MDNVFWVVYIVVAPWHGLSKGNLCTDAAMARKLRLSVRKNDERKKRRNIRCSLVVSIQRDSIAIMTVSLSTKHYLSAPVPSLSVRIVMYNSVIMCNSIFITGVCG